MRSEKRCGFHGTCTVIGPIAIMSSASRALATLAAAFLAASLAADSSPRADMGLDLDLDLDLDRPRPPL